MGTVLSIVGLCLTLAQANPLTLTRRTNVDMVAVLAMMAKDTSDMVRDAVRVAKEKEATEATVLSTVRDASDRVRDAVRDAVREAKEKETTEATVLSTVRDASDRVRDAVIDAVREAKEKEATEANSLSMVKDVRDASDRVRDAVIDAVREVKEKEATEANSLSMVKDVKDASDAVIGEKGVLTEAKSSQHTVDASATNTGEAVQKYVRGGSV